MRTLTAMPESYAMARVQETTPSFGHRTAVKRVAADIAATARNADALSLVDAATAQGVQRETAVRGYAVVDALMAAGATTTTTLPKLGTIEAEHAEQREYHRGLGT